MRERFQAGGQGEFPVYSDDDDDSEMLIMILMKVMTVLWCPQSS